jgi:hypothetical protein
VEEMVAYFLNAHKFDVEEDSKNVAKEVKQIYDSVRVGNTVTPTKPSKRPPNRGSSISEKVHDPDDPEHC